MKLEIKQASNVNIGTVTASTCLSRSGDKSNLPRSANRGGVES